MKKLILSIAVLSGLAFTTQAQTEKGKVILGGSVGFNTNKVKSADKADVNFNVVPSVGYFLGDNFAVGTGVGYTFDKSVSGGEQTEAFQVAPFGRYYVPVADKFQFFGQLSVPMAFGTTKATDADLEVGDKTGSSTSIGVALSPGFAYYPSKKIGIEFALNGASYNHYTLKDANGDKKDADSSDAFSIGTDFFAPKLGIQFHF